MSFSAVFYARRVCVVWFVTHSARAHEMYNAKQVARSHSTAATQTQTRNSHTADRRVFGTARDVHIYIFVDYSLLFDLIVAILNQ